MDEVQLSVNSFLLLVINKELFKNASLPGKKRPKKSIVLLVSS